MAAKFEVYEGKNGKYYFRLKSGNGEVICTSQGYASEAGAERVQENACKKTHQLQKSSSSKAKIDVY